MSVSPQAGTNSQTIGAGAPIEAIPANPSGGFITNPSSGADQGLANAEPLYVNAVTDANLNGNGTTFVLYPGQTWEVIPGQTTITSVASPSAGHKYSAVWWP